MDDRYRGWYAYTIEPNSNLTRGAWGTRQWGCTVLHCCIMS